mgnify:CR=1 FL=1
MKINLKNYIRYKYIIAGIIISIAIYSCDQEVSTEPPDTLPPNASIFVSSNPSGFKIFLNDKFTGRFTPDSLPFLEEGYYDIKLDQKYWNDTVITVRTIEDSTIMLNIDILSNPKMFGSIKLSSKPSSASIYFQDSLLENKTPYTIDDLLPGKYNFRFAYPEHRENVISTIVESNKLTNVVVALQDTSIWVDYTKLNSNLPTDILTTVDVDHDNQVWVGTVDKGIVRIKGNQFEVFNQANSNLPSDRINKVLVSSSNEVWVGTASGIVKFSDPSFMTIYHTNNSDLISNGIVEIVENDDQSIWIGTTGGISIIENETLISYRLVGALVPSRANVDELTVLSVMPTSESVAWVGINDVITRFHRNNATFRVQDFRDIGFPTQNMVGIERDNQDNLWSVFTPSEYTLPNVSPPVTLELIGGLSTRSGERWVSTLIGDMSSVIRDIYIDREDNKWISSDIGLLKFTTIYSSKAYRPSNSGILSEDVTSVSEDSNGTLWITTKDGLSKYKKSKLP